MLLDINKLGAGPNFANPEEAARGQEPGGDGANHVPSGSPGQWPPEGDGALCCSSGPAGPRAGIRSPGLPTGREAIPPHAGPALLPHAPEPGDL